MQFAAQVKDIGLKLLRKIYGMELQVFNVEEHEEPPRPNSFHTGQRKPAKRRKYRKEQDLG